MGGTGKGMTKRERREADAARLGITVEELVNRRSVKAPKGRKKRGTGGVLNQGITVEHPRAGGWTEGIKRRMLGKGGGGTSK